MKRALLLLATLLATPASAATTAITGGRVMTGVGEQVIENGTVIVRDGRIAAVGVGLPVPAGAQVIDAAGKVVTPGLIAGMSQLAVSEVEGVRQTNDTAARGSPFSAALDLAPAVNANTIHFAIDRLGGVTRAVIGPDAGSEIFGGQGAVISLAAAGDPLMKARAFQFIELGETGARLAGGSRPAAWASLANALAEAQRYARNPAAFGGQTRDALTKRLDAEALAQLIAGQMPAVIHVERASDILEVLKLKDRYPRLRPILIGAREAWLVADRIAAAKVPVVTLTLFDLPDDFETLASTRSNVGHLAAAGVMVALGVFGGDSAAQPRNLPYFAGNAVAQAAVPGARGLSPGQALAAITSNPARIFGLSDLGTLEAGKRADVVVWDGDPFDVISAPTAVLIDGVAQPMTSRQTQLRDRYKDLGRSDLPLQYPR